MNTITQQFVDALQKRPDVIGVILFGSWARGNYRDNSNVDLLVIVQEGYRRTVEVVDNQVFEIVFTTEQGAVDFWQSSPDEAVEFWCVAQVLFDRDGTVIRLKAVGAAIRAQGKKPLSDDEYAHLVFDVRDQIKAAQALEVDDPTTAKILLHMKVLQLTEVFFDVRQLWTPPPKQRLAIIKQHDLRLYDLIVQFYVASSVPEQIPIARELADHIIMR
jgi:hypothetical protein